MLSLLHSREVLAFFTSHALGSKSKAITSAAIVLACACLLSCGGGGSSSDPQPDFSLSTQPATLVIAPGGTRFGSDFRHWSKRILRQCAGRHDAALRHNRLSQQFLSLDRHSRAVDNIGCCKPLSRHCNALIHRQFRLGFSYNTNARHHRSGWHKSASSFSLTLPQNRPPVQCH